MKDHPMYIMSAVVVIIISLAVVTPVEATTPTVSTNQSSIQLTKFSNNTSSNNTAAANGIIVLLPPISRAFPILTVIERTTENQPTPDSFFIQVFHSNGIPLGSPFKGSSTGTHFLVSPDTYQVYQPPQNPQNPESTSQSYVAHYSGDCDSSGFVQLSYFMSKTCVITLTTVVP